jgi:hypothetical protein
LRGSDLQPQGGVLYEVVVPGAYRREEIPAESCHREPLFISIHR